ncbi:MAG: glycosyltransferase, partial [Chryseobacterium sp.]|nr:glycosyltransferase [Candidatus Chryseobacterium enterohippi]
HIAINKGLEMANGSYFLVIDSDDYLLQNVINILLKYVKRLKDKKQFAGFTFIRFMERTPYNPNNYGHKEWVNDQPYEWEFHGEMSFCYKTEIARHFPFPQFEGEKFCPESIVHRRIAKNYDVLFTDHVLASGEYLQDGLSSKYNQLMEKSPRAGLLSYAEKIGDSKNNKNLRKQFAKNYWDLAIKAPQITWIERFCAIPLSLSIWYWKNRLLK